MASTFTKADNVTIPGTFGDPISVPYYLQFVPGIVTEVVTSDRSFQSFNKAEYTNTILNNSFQTLQKKLKDLLAQVIKDVSKKREINVVFLKENVFLFNDPSIDITNEVLDLFNKKTKSMSITITLNDKPF